MCVLSSQTYGYFMIMMHLVNVWIDRRPVKESVPQVDKYIFTKDEEGARAAFGEYNEFYQRPGNEHLIQFHEYFHGDSGKGLGANHQTGWTALIADLIERLAK